MTREEAIKRLRWRIKMIHESDPARFWGNVEPRETDEEKLFKVCLAALEELERNRTN